LLGFYRQFIIRQDAKLAQLLGTICRQTTLRNFVIILFDYIIILIMELYEICFIFLEIIFLALTILRFRSTKN